MGYVYTNAESISGFRLLFEYSTSESIENNTSTVYWTVSLTDGDSSWVYCNDIRLWYGNTYSDIVTSRQKVYRGKIGSGSFTVAHSSNGAGSFSIGLSGAVNSYSKTCKVETSFTLPTIPRASTISMPSSVNIGDTVRININKASSSFTSTLWYYIWYNGAWHAYNNNGLVDKTRSEFYDWSLTGSDAAFLQKEMHGYGVSEMRMVIDTYSGSTKVGSSEARFTMNNAINKASIPSSIIGDRVTVTVDKNSANTSSIVKYAFGGASGTVTGATTERSFGWSIPSDLAAQIPNSESGTITLTTETYSAGVYVTSYSSNYTLSINKENSLPTVELSVVDCNPKTIALTNDVNTMIKYESNAKVSMSATPRNYATIYKTYCYHGSTSVGDGGVIKGVLGSKFGAQTIDSRGLTDDTAVYKNLVEYVKPTAILNVGNPILNSDGKTGTAKVTIKGDYFKGKFGSAGVANTINLYYRMKEDKGSFGSWTAITSITYPQTNSYEGTISVKVPDYKKSYTFEAKISDKLHTDVLSNSKTVRTTPVFDWGENDFNFNVPVKTEGKLKAYGGLELDSSTPNVPSDYILGLNGWDVSWSKASNYAVGSADKVDGWDIEYSNGYAAPSPAYLCAFDTTNNKIKCANNAYINGNLSINGDVYSRNHPLNAGYTHGSKDFNISGNSYNYICDIPLSAAGVYIIDWAYERLNVTQYINRFEYVDDVIYTRVYSWGGGSLSGDGTSIIKTTAPRTLRVRFYGVKSGTVTGTLYYKIVRVG